MVTSNLYPIHKVPKTIHMMSNFAAIATHSIVTCVNHDSSFTVHLGCQPQSPERSVTYNIDQLRNYHLEQGVLRPYLRLTVLPGEFYHRSCHDKVAGGCDVRPWLVRGRCCWGSRPVDDPLRTNQWRGYIRSLSSGEEGRSALDRLRMSLSIALSIAMWTSSMYVYSNVYLCGEGWSLNGRAMQGRKLGLLAS